MTSSPVIFTLLAIIKLLSAYRINDSFVSNERKLYHNLLDEYEKSVRPVRHESDTVAVQLHLALISIEDLDEASQVLYTTSWLRLLWQDFQLQWNPEDYGGVREIRIPITEIWSPDILVYNSVEPDMMLPSHHLAVIIYTGEVLWIPQLSLSSHCPIDVYYFPFDTQVCNIKLGSWTYHQQMVDVHPMDENVNLGNFIESNQWKIVETSAKRNEATYACCNESYVDITFSMTLERHSSFALHLFLGPSVTLSLVISAVFIMPAGSKEKIVMGVGSLIAHVLLLGELVKFLPSGHHLSIPLIAHFFVANIVLVGLSLVISTVIINFWSRGVSRNSGPPALLKMAFLNQIITKLLCFNFSEYTYGCDTGFENPISFIHHGPGGSIEAMTSDIPSSTDDRVRIVLDKERYLAASEWLRLADIIDRLFFILYLVVIVVLCLSFLHYL